jgi:hypothetical protein
VDAPAWDSSLWADANEGDAVGSGDAPPAGDSGPWSDADSGDAIVSDDGTPAGEAGAAETGGLYLCGAPPGVAHDDAGATQIISNIGSESTYLGGNVGGVWRNGDRLVASQGQTWSLWDLTTRALVSAGTGTLVGFGGPVFLVEVDGINPSYSFEARSLSDGSLQGSIGITASEGLTSGPPPSGLATDGSYFWVATGYYDSSFNPVYVLRTWSPTGTPLATRLGNYVSASIAAVPGELRIANGPAGSVIEHVSAATGASSSSPPFSATFRTWFADGSRFVAAVGTTHLFVYDDAATKLSLFSVASVGVLPGNVGGGGDYVFNRSDSGQGTDVYQIGGNGQAVAHYSDFGAPFWSNSTLALPAGSDALTVVRLDASLATATYPLPHVLEAPASGFQYRGLSAFAADANGDFAVGSALGSLYFQGTSRAPSASGMLGCGSVVSVAGSTEGTGVVATASGNLFVVDVPTSTVRADLGIAADEVALSGDGKTLALLERANDAGAVALDILALPAGSVLHTFTGAPAPLSFSLSQDGTTLARRLPNETDVTDLSGTNSLLTIAGALPVSPALSPSGKYVAAPEGAFPPSTQLFAQGTLVSAMNGTAIGWTDDNHLLVQLSPYRSTPGPSTLYDNQGNVLAMPALPILTAFSAITATTIYSRDDGNLYDVTTGSLVSRTSLPGGVVAGARILAPEGPALVGKTY